MDADGEPQKDSHRDDKEQEERVLPPQEGHGAVMNLIGNIHHHPASGILALHVPIDQKGENEAHSA